MTFCRSRLSVTTEANVTPGQRVSIRNRHVLVGSISIACAGIFARMADAPPGWLWLALTFSAVCVWIFVLELPGVAVAPTSLSFPRRHSWFPIFPIWRRRLLLSQVDGMTLLPPWYGFQVVRLDGQFGSERLLFDTRKARLRWFDAVRGQRPHIAIYRER